MKNKLFKSLFLFTLLIGLVSCNKEEIKEEPIEVENITQIGKSSSEEGEFIDNITTIPSSFIYSSNNVVDDSGMEGSCASFHYHEASQNPRETMFLTEARQEENYLILELEEVRSLGHLYIWNYNHTNYLTSQVKEFRVYLSLDNITYYSFNEGEIYTLSQYEGNKNEYHSLISNQDYLDLEGISSKYIKLEFLSNYGGNNYGLSEIRLYNFKEETKENNIVTSYPFFKKEETKDTNQYHLVSQDGLNEVYSLDSLHDNDPLNMYLTSKREITFFLNGKYPLKEVRIFNYNNPLHLDYGVKDLTISYSLDGTNFTSLGDYTLEKGTGEETYKCNNIISLNNIETEYIRFRFNSNYKNTNQYGLSEVQFVLGNGEVVERNNYYTYLHSQYNGWTGSDGVFNTRLSGDQSIKDETEEVSIFNYSDTYFGTVDPKSKRRNNPTMLNNSFGLFKRDDKKISFFEENYNHITPNFNPLRSPNDAYYWLGDSFVVGDYYYVSALYIARQGVLGFEQRGEDLARFNIIDDETIDFSSLTLIEDKETNKLSYFSEDNNLSIIFGSAIFENTTLSQKERGDGYIYNYGYRDDRVNGFTTRSLVVSRVLENEVEDFSKYQYYSEDGWVSDITLTQPLLSNVSCEMGVFLDTNPLSPTFNSYGIVYQEYTTGNNIMVSYSSNLVDFEEGRILYSIEDKLLMDGLNYYNGKSHPTLSSYNKLVISYNLNEGEFGLNSSNCEIYRPRFFDLYYI